MINVSVVHLGAASSSYGSTRYKIQSAASSSEDWEHRCQIALYTSHAARRPRQIHPAHRRDRASSCMRGNHRSEDTSINGTKDTGYPIVHWRPLQSIPAIPQCTQPQFKTRGGVFGLLAARSSELMLHGRGPNQSPWKFLSGRLPGLKHNSCQTSLTQNLDEVRNICPPPCPYVRTYVSRKSDLSPRDHLLALKGNLSSHKPLL